MTNQELLDELAKRLFNSEKKKELIEITEELKKAIDKYHPKPMSTKEVCEKYQISSRTISRKVAAGLLTPITNYGKYLFNEEDIRRII